MDACGRARAAQAAWAATPAPVRGRAVQQAGRLVEANAEALARTVTREVGKPLAEARAEVQEVVDTCDFFLGEGRRLYGQTVPSELPDKQLFTFRAPVGVAAIVTAGNFPVAVPSWYVVPALLCGNAVVWKPSEEAAACADALARAAAARRLPRACSSSCSPTAPRPPPVWSRRSRTGWSTRSASPGSTRGRAPDRRAVRPPPAVALPGARRQEPARRLRRRGRRPGGGGRALQRVRHGRPALHVPRHGVVHEDVHDEFLAKLVARVEDAPIGDPTQDVLYGPMISARFLERFLDEWLGSSATTTRCTAPRRRAHHARLDPRGASWAATRSAGSTSIRRSSSGVRADDELANTETFGPLVGVAPSATGRRRWRWPTATATG